MKLTYRSILGALLAAAAVGAAGASVSAADRELVDRWRDRPTDAAERPSRRVAGGEERERRERGRWEDRLPALRPPVASPH